MSENEFTIKEVFEKYMNSMDVIIKEIHSDVKEIKLQTQKTNGRVTKLEDKLEDYDKVKLEIEDYKTQKTKVYTTIVVGAAFCGLLGTLFFLLINTKLDNQAQMIDRKINNAVSSALEDYHLEGIVR